MKTLSRGHLKAGIDSVRSAKLRSFWTMLGVIIGVSSVITVVAIGEGIKDQISSQVHHFGNNFITVRPAQIKAGSDSSPNTSSILSGLQVSGPLTKKDIEIVENTPGVAVSAPLTLTSGSVSGDNGSYKGGYVIGTGNALPSLLNQSLAYGGFFEQGDETENVAVLGQNAAEAMFKEDVPLGQTFTFHGQEFIVLGVFNKFTNAPLSQQADFNDAIFIPNEVAETLSNNTAPTYEILARADSKSKPETVAADISKGINRAHGSDSGFAVLTGDQSLESSDNILNLLTRLIAGVAAISLLVGGIGIMNVMLVSVTERMHEIGIRKAVGATNRQILSQFIVESTLLSLTGGIIGILIAIMIDVGIRLSTSLQPIITWQIVVISTGVSLLVGVIFGTVPAFQAARKDPIEALRSE
jgi:putative ABC transport system permease protein